MHFVSKFLKPELFIRLGLSLTFLYSGYDIVFNAKNAALWEGYINSLPAWVLEAIKSYSSLHTFLFIQGATELIFGALLLFWFLPKKYIKYIAIFISLKFILILWFIGIDPITFRDIGLLGMSLALLSISSKRRY